MTPVFPAYAGMSPHEALAHAHEVRFPRLRGDEPIADILDTTVKEFSPPTRG